MSKTIDLVAEEWIRGRLARQEISQATAYGQLQLLRDFARHVGPEKPITEIETRHVEGWLALPRRNGAAYSPQSINSRSNPIRTFLKWAAVSGLIHIDPAATVGRAKIGKRLPKGLSQEDVARLLWVSDIRDRTLILVGVQLGLRRAEIAGMNIEHWDRRDDVLYVIGKFNKERAVPVMGETASVLDAWIAMGLHGARRGPFWPSNYASDGRLSIEHVGRCVKHRAEQSGVNATTHSLRHTCGTDLVRAGAPMPIVQAWLGHESVATTGLYVVPAASELRVFGDARTYMPEGLRIPDAA